MYELVTETAGLAVASGMTTTTAAGIGSGAAAAAPAMTEVLPGTASPAVILGTARVVEHGANKLAVSTAAATVVAAVASAYGACGLGYEVVDDASAVGLLV
jgi:hypothetical protein